jgi:hypothetical protein
VKQPPKSGDGGFWQSVSVVHGLPVFVAWPPPSKGGIVSSQQTPGAVEPWQV